MSNAVSFRAAIQINEFMLGGTHNLDSIIALPCSARTGQLLKTTPTYSRFSLFYVEWLGCYSHPRATEQRVTIIPDRSFIARTGYIGDIMRNRGVCSFLTSSTIYLSICSSRVYHTTLIIWRFVFPHVSVLLKLDIDKFHSLQVYFELLRSTILNITSKWNLICSKVF